MVEKSLVNASDNSHSSLPCVDKGKAVMVVESTQPRRFKPTDFMTSVRRSGAEPIT